MRTITKTAKCSRCHVTFIRATKKPRQKLCSNACRFADARDRFYIKWKTEKRNV